MLPHELEKFFEEHKKASKEFSWEPDFGNSKTVNPSDDNIQRLKLLMDPIVHIHKDAILQKKLPGLKNCVLRLKNVSYHKQILESIQSSHNTMIFENNQIMASIHLYLFLECTLTEQEESVVDKDRLEKRRLNHVIGIKTRFLVEFASICDAANEKVFVFGQFLRPLCLIMDQLMLVLKWTEDEEILYMYAKVQNK
jgi:DNA repair and recombination RAD54-like protein